MSQNGSASASAEVNQDMTPAPTSNTTGAAVNKTSRWKMHKEAYPVPPGFDPELWGKCFSNADSQIYNRNKKDAKKSGAARASGETRILALALYEKRIKKLELESQNSDPKTTKPSLNTTTSSAPKPSQTNVEAPRQVNTDPSTSREGNLSNSSDPNNSSSIMAGKGKNKSQMGNKGSSKNTLRQAPLTTDEPVPAGASFLPDTDESPAHATSQISDSRVHEPRAFGPSTSVPTASGHQQSTHIQSSNTGSNHSVMSDMNHQDHDMPDVEVTDVEMAEAPVVRESSYDRHLREARASNVAIWNERDRIEAEERMASMSPSNTSTAAGHFTQRPDPYAASNLKFPTALSGEFEGLGLDSESQVESSNHYKRSASHFSATSRPESPTDLKPNPSANDTTEVPSNIGPGAKRTAQKKAAKKRRKQALQDAQDEEAASSASNTPAPRPAPSSKGKGKQVPRSTRDTSTTEESDDEKYCICRGPDDGRLMVACDVCDSWFHFQCVGISEADAPLVDRYVCSVCALKQTQKTSYKVMCRLGGCRKPADVANQSKYCSNAHRLEWAQRLVDRMPTGPGPSVGGALTRGELKAALDFTKGEVGGFHRLGRKPELPAGQRPVDFSTVLTAEEKARLVQIRIEEAELGAQRKGYVEKEELVRLAITRLTNNLKNGGEDMKGLCGWDPRLALNEWQFLKWRNSPEGITAMTTKVLLEDGCDRKRCMKHTGWVKASLQDIREEILQIDKADKKLNVEEHAMKARAESRLIIDRARKR